MKQKAISGEVLGGVATVPVKPKEGAPSLYREEYNDLARKLCLLGAKDKEIADVIGVTEQTINNWKNEFPKFFESLKAGKEAADAQLGQRLYDRAMGYSHPDVHICQYEGQVITTEITKHYPPDTTAAIFWLKNRRPKEWRDRQEHTLQNPDGTNLLPQSVIDAAASLAKSL